METHGEAGTPGRALPFCLPSSEQPLILSCFEFSSRSEPPSGAVVPWASKLSIISGLLAPELFLMNSGGLVTAGSVGTCPDVARSRRGR